MPKTSPVSSVSLRPPIVNKASSGGLSMPLQPQRSPISNIGSTNASNTKSQKKSSSRKVIPPSSSQISVSSMQREQAKSRRTSIYNTISNIITD